MENKVCHITICIGPVFHLDLDHMHCPCTIVFVGGDEAKREAAAYHVKHIEDNIAANDALMTFWLDTKPESGSQ